MARFNELINTSQPVLVDFFSEGSEPCEKMLPVLAEIAANVGDKARIIKVDVGKNPMTAGAYGIRAVPTILVFKKGEIQWRQSGLIPAHRLLDILSILT